MLMELYNKFKQILMDRDYNLFQRALSKLFVYFPKELILENIEDLKKIYEVLKKETYDSKKIKGAEKDNLAILKNKLKICEELPYIKTRFAPSPTGRLHIGHSRILSIIHFIQNTWREKTEFTLRIEDTDLSNSTPVYIREIIREVEALGLKIDKILIQSERIELYIGFLRELLAKNIAYVCSCISNQKTCDCKKNQSLRLHEKFLKGDFLPKELCAKCDLDLSSKDPALQKIILMRGQLDNNKTVLRRLMNFAVSVDDYLENQNFILRGADHIQNIPKQKKLFEYFGTKEYPTYLNLGRVILEKGILSASKISQLINDNKISSWEDPTLLTLGALLFTHKIPASTIREYWMDFLLNKGKIYFNISKFNSLLPPQKRLNI